jgi:2'-aminobiphenyl-2,3-diol 1,2-dioxygenase, large subunit
MGKIVSAVATSHILMSKNGAEEPAARVFDGMMRIGRHVRESKPDVIVIISNDHMFNVGPEISAPFLIACGERFVPFGEMDIPREEFRGKPEFASALASFAEQNGSPLYRLDTLRPDHGTAVPLLFANPNRDIAVLPIFVNYDRNPPPSPTDCWKLGTLLQHFITLARPKDERVAVIGAGGLSHWVGYENTTINEEFDRRFLSAMESGDLKEWRARPAADIRREGGNGGLEIMSWLTMAAVVPEARAEVVYYEPMPSWMTGMGGVVMKWQESSRASSGTVSKH